MSGYCWLIITALAQRLTKYLVPCLKTHARIYVSTAWGLWMGRSGLVRENLTLDIVQQKALYVMQSLIEVVV